MATKKLKLAAIWAEPIPGVAGIAQHGGGELPETLVRIVTRGADDPVAAVRETLETMADGKLVAFVDPPEVETRDGADTELRYSFYLADVAVAADAADAKPAGAYLGYDP